MAAIRVKKTNQIMHFGHEDEVDIILRNGEFADDGEAPLYLRRVEEGEAVFVSDSPITIDERLLELLCEYDAAPEWCDFLDDED